MLASLLSYWFCAGCAALLTLTTIGCASRPEDAGGFPLGPRSARGDAESDLSLTFRSDGWTLATRDATLDLDATAATATFDAGGEETFRLSACDPETTSCSDPFRGVSDELLAFASDTADEFVAATTEDERSDFVSFPRFEHMRECRIIVGATVALGALAVGSTLRRARLSSRAIDALQDQLGVWRRNESLRPVGKSLRELEEETAAAIAALREKGFLGVPEAIAVIGASLGAVGTAACAVVDTLVEVILGPIRILSFGRGPA